MSWHSLETFSFKDLISGILIFTFVGITIFSLLTGNLNAMSIITTYVPIVLAILGIYGTTEGVQLFSNKYKSNTFINETEINSESYIPEEEVKG